MGHSKTSRPILDSTMTDLPAKELPKSASEAVDSPNADLKTLNSRHPRPPTVHLPKTDHPGVDAPAKFPPIAVALSTDIPVPNLPTPQRTCSTTGDKCIDTCFRDTTDNMYQWCGSCNYYVACQYGITSYYECPNSLVWDDDFKWCSPNTTTCDCIE